MLPLPKPPWLFSPDLALCRIQELKKFWADSQDEPGPRSLSTAIEHFMQGLHFPVGLVLRHLQGELWAGWMARKNSGLRESLESALPGILLQPEPLGGPGLLRSMPRLSSALIVHGHPANPLEKDAVHTPDPLGLDVLVQGLSGYNWLYLSLALPLGRGERRQELQKVYQREKEMQARYLRPGTALEKNNPGAQTALEEIQATKTRLEEGLRTGLWHAVTLLYLDDKAGISAGMSLLRSLFSGQQAKPGTLRFEVCMADAPSANAGRPMPYTVLNSRDVARFMHIPAQEYQGYPVRARTEFDRHISKTPKGHTIYVGSLQSQPHSEICLSPRELCKHMLISGTTGSGKTNTCLSILTQAWKEHSIPFLVLETSEKTEYASRLKDLLGSDLQVFSLGDEQKNPLHLDLLHVPAGRHIEAHLGHLMRIFKAAFPLPPPTPYLLEEGLRLWYSRAGWDLEQGYRAKQGPPLRFEDLSGIVRDLLNSKYAHYDPQTRGNIESALLVRLESLSRGGSGRFLAGQGEHEQKWEDLLQRPVVMELSTLTDPDKKALAVLFILYRLMSSAHQLYAKDPGRVHLTVVEEAHRVLKDLQPSQHPDVADTQAAMVEEFANALSEVRYAGEGLIILDQMPSRLSPAVLANTNIKLGHRLPMQEEQQCLAKAAGLNEQQTSLLYRLSPGEALWLPADGGAY
ncbi:MAG: ATP-binding protein, partial [Desulfohalobiaceae bacterium]